MAKHTVHRSFLVKKAGLVVGTALLAVTAGCADAGVDDTGETESVGQVQDELLLPRLCGGYFDLECRSNEVCIPLLARGCPGPRRIGLCFPRPQRCLPLTLPVCGCDGNTYANLCEAAKNGVAIEHRGECSETGMPVCGGAAGMECAGSSECVDDPGDSCDPTTNGDCPGVCECNVIEPCDPGEVFDEDPTVCGCVPEVIDPDPCAGIICPDGTECVEQPDGTPLCQPSP